MRESWKGASAKLIASRGIRGLRRSHRQAPLDRRYAARFEIPVRRGEMPAADEAAVCGQGRRVRRLQHEVAARVDELAFRLRVRAPQHEHEPVALAVEAVD